MGQINEPQWLSFFPGQSARFKRPKRADQKPPAGEASNLQKFEHKLPSSLKGSNLGGILRWGREKKTSPVTVLPFWHYYHRHIFVGTPMITSLEPDSHPFKKKAWRHQLDDSNQIFTNWKWLLNNQSSIQFKPGCFRFQVYFQQERPPPKLKRNFASDLS